MMSYGDFVKGKWAKQQKAGARSTCEGSKMYFVIIEMRSNGETMSERGDDCEWMDCEWMRKGLGMDGMGMDGMGVRVRMCEIGGVR